MLIVGANNKFPNLPWVEGKVIFCVIPYYIS